MAILDDAKAVMQGLSGKVLTNQQGLSIAEKYAKARRMRNPWTEQDPATGELLYPAENAAWPTNEELATFFVTDVRQTVRGSLKMAADYDFEDTAQAQRQALRDQYADEL